MNYKNFFYRIFIQHNKVPPRQKWWAMLFLAEYKKRFSSYERLRIKVLQKQIVFLVGDPLVREMHIRELDPKSEGAHVTFLIRPTTGTPLLETEEFSDNPARMNELWQHIEICRAYKHAQELVW